MLRLMICVPFGLSVSLSVGGWSAAHGAEQEQTSKRSNRAVKKEPERYEEPRNRKSSDEDEYAARAHDADPSGAYKSLPNWARAGLGTKPYGR